ncbi:MAG: glycoside hydrolase family 2, partial [Chitinophagaceae bacterium]|nr:glycoside hydrolase family 2 [Chitinophagaceae bacterium]
MLIFLLLPVFVFSQTVSKGVSDFNKGWKLLMREENKAQVRDFDDASWRSVDLPHDGSIEGSFEQRNPVGVHGGFLPTGTYMYRKSFFIDAANKNKDVYIDFDGVYRNSEVWINGHYLGKRPNGYITFRYELTNFIKYGAEKNVLVVKADNAAQPSSRWYTGTGIYRNVRLAVLDKVHVRNWGIAITTPSVTKTKATIVLKTTITNNLGSNQPVVIKQILLDKEGKQVTVTRDSLNLTRKEHIREQQLTVQTPHLWSDKDPFLYTIITQVIYNKEVKDEHRTRYGIRHFKFDPQEGFILNERKLKIRGVCNHHDLGCLGAAVNRSAIKRQLQILKEMGCNGIRTSHNPPAPELLDLCDEMGFIVMDEAFDIWKTAKTYFDYHWNWDEWHKRDLEDQVLRDRNHPSVFIWSIGNEIPEQTGSDQSGSRIAAELKSIVSNIDPTRPVTAGNNHPDKGNNIIKSGALDLIGVNYHHDEWKHFNSYYPGQVFIGTETVSALQTRGEYKFPSDKLMRWGNTQNPVTNDIYDFTCSAFDQTRAPWGSTHEETLKVFRRYDFLSGMYVWSGFDYLGEPTPFSWPARSSY